MLTIIIVMLETDLSCMSVCHTGQIWPDAVLRDVKVIHGGYIPYSGKFSPDITLLRGMLTMQASKGLNINYVGI